MASWHGTSSTPSSDGRDLRGSNDLPTNGSPSAPQEEAIVGNPSTGFSYTTRGPFDIDSRSGCIEGEVPEKKEQPLSTGMNRNDDQSSWHLPSVPPEEAVLTRVQRNRTINVDSAVANSGPKNEENTFAVA